MLAALFIAAFLPFAGAGTAAPPSQDAMTQFLATLAPGQWGHIPNSAEAPLCYQNENSLSPVPPDYSAAVAADITGSGQCRSPFILWSGAAYDPDDNVVIIAAGGHAGYCGNELYTFNLSTTKWERWTTPDDCNFNTSVQPPAGQIAANGDPLSMHNYTVIMYLPSAGAKGSFLWFSPSNGFSYWDIAHKPALCDFTAPGGLQTVRAPCAPTPLGTPQSGWKLTSATSKSLSFSAPIGGLDPTTGKVWYLQQAVGGAGPSPAVYDPTQDTGAIDSGWSFPTMTTTAGTNTIGGYFTGNVPAVVRTPAREIWGFPDNIFDNSNVIVWNMGNLTMQKYLVGSGAAWPYWVGPAYDSDLDKLVIETGVGGDGLTIIDPTTSPPTMTSHVTTGGSSLPNVACNQGSPTCTNGIMTRFFYDKVHKCFVYLVDSPDDVWVWKPDL